MMPRQETSLGGLGAYHPFTSTNPVITLGQFCYSE